MRCPHCGGLNPDTAGYCIRCGRDFHKQSQQRVNNPQPPYQPASPAQGTPRPFQPTQQTGYPPGPQTYQPPQQVPQGYPPQAPQGYPPQPMPQPQPGPVRPPVAQARVAAPPAKKNQKRAPVKQTVEWTELQPARPLYPEAPYTFPPTSSAQLKVFEKEALEYEILDDTESYNNKKVIHIKYKKCAGWQQVATLLAALSKHGNVKQETIVIEGFTEHDNLAYGFTNGQLIYDRNVRLGSQVLKRYQIETENGFASDAVRIVITE